MIQAFNLHKSYGGGAPALQNVSFTIQEGEFVFLTGQSGAGKTTLFKILFGWEALDRGQVLVGGINVGKLNENNLYTLRRKVGVVFQDYKLLPKKTVFENVAFAQQIIGADKKTIRFNTWDALKSVGLTNKKDAYPPQLSGGEQQRVAIARALVNDPQLILADEPTGNLDPEISLEILELFEKMNQQGKTVIMATHSLEMLQVRDHRLLILNRGRIVQS
jgi:cell division transport system ATP-binding protein